jgi:hypothetical protein
MTSLQQTAMGGGAATAKTASYVLVAADAGTTVAMNAAGATTITVNTGLFAAGDTVFIQNLGAGACTVTAGTATVATAGSLILPQNDAGILYFTATGASIFYDYIQTGAVSPLTTKGDLYTFSTSDARLAVGANGTTLVADSAEATGLKWAGFKGCALTQTSAQALVTSTNVVITFNAETFDTDAFHSTSSNTGRITIPAGLGGYYRFYFTIGLNAQTNGRRMCSLRLNGTTSIFTVETSELGQAFVNPTLTDTGTVSLVATDYLECVYYQDSGSTINTNGTADRVNFGVAYLGA